LKDKKFELKRIGILLHKKEFLGSNEIIIALKLVCFLVTIVFYYGIKIYIVKLKK